MSRRYLFLCPDVVRASGGVAVIYDMAVALRRNGYDAVIVHNGPAGAYADYPAPPPMFHSPAIREVYARWSRRLHQRLRGRAALLRDRLRTGGLAQIAVQPQDVIVAPEFMLAEAMAAFPRHRLVVCVQNPFSFLESFELGLSHGLDIRSRADAFLGVSDVCMDQFDLLGIEGAFYLPVSMKPEAFPFRAEKQPLITYMPRKRHKEAAIVARALLARGRIGGYRLESIDNLPMREVSARMQDSRFFISFQRQESIGFPAAEAMAAGCIVIGYTGLGGREYFTPETGIPVTEDDTLALVRAVEAAVADYAADPARLDRMRRVASETINRRYSSAGFQTHLLEIWRRIDGQLSDAAR